MFLYICSEDDNLPMMFEKLFIFASYFVEIGIYPAWITPQHTYSQTSYFLKLTQHSGISGYKAISVLKQWFYLQLSFILMRILSWKVYYSLFLVKWLNAGGLLQVNPVNQECSL